MNEVQMGREERFLEYSTEGTARSGLFASGGRTKPKKSLDVFKV